MDGEVISSGIVFLPPGSGDAFGAGDVGQRMDLSILGERDWFGVIVVRRGGHDVDFDWVVEEVEGA